MKPLDHTRWKAFKDDRLVRNYERVFEPLVSHREIRLLELGVYEGGSLAMWADYFEGGTIVGLDMREPLTFSSPRVKAYQGSQADAGLLTRIAEETAPGGFDVIIDDCSHLAEWSRTSFWHLFEHHLKPGGIYVIEDWGTGYLDAWPDGRPLAKNFRQRRSWRTAVSWSLEWIMARVPGLSTARTRAIQQRLASLVFWRQRLRSHSYGMAGLVKQVLDEFGIRHSRLDLPTWVERVEIDASQVFIFKKQKLE